MRYRLPLLQSVLLLTMVSALGASPSSAQVVFSFSGATDPTDPTFARAFVFGGSCNPSSFGTNVAYDAYTFTPSQDGFYNIFVAFSPVPPGTSDDGYLYVYEGSFDPNDPCKNLIGDDIATSSPGELFDLRFRAGTDYIIVVSSYRNDEYVAYNGTVTRTGDLPQTVFTFGGDTTDDPTFRRAFVSSTSCSPSVIATAVRYETFTFMPPRDSEYAVQADYDFDFDGYLFLYEDSFDPSEPCLNLLASDDDYPGSDETGSRIESVMLMAGTTYVIVVTGNGNDDFGVFTGFVEDLNAVSTPDVDLTATATSPLTVAPGGSIGFDYSVTNTSGAQVCGDLYFTADTDQGGQVASGRIRGGCLDDGDSIGASFTQQVPAGAPAGTYTYCLEIGSFSAMSSVDQECFAVVVTGSRPALAVLQAGVALTDPASELEYDRWRESFQGLVWAVTDVSPWEATGTTVTNAPTDAVGVYPNPFAGSAQIAFALDATADVRLAVYDVLGREVAVLVDAELDAGSHSAAFDAAGLPTGTYLYRLRVGGAVQTGQLSLVK